MTHRSHGRGRPARRTPPRPASQPPTNSKSTSADPAHTQPPATGAPYGRTCGEPPRSSGRTARVRKPTAHRDALPGEPLSRLEADRPRDVYQGCLDVGRTGAEGWRVLVGHAAAPCSWGLSGLPPELRRLAVEPAARLASPSRRPRAVRVTMAGWSSGAASLAANNGRGARLSSSGNGLDDCAISIPCGGPSYRLKSASKRHSLPVSVACDASRPSTRRWTGRWPTG